MTSLIKLSE